MSYDGSTQCPDDACVTNLTIPDFECGEILDQAWADKLNKAFADLAGSLCCVSGSIPDGSLTTVLDSPVTVLNIAQLRSSGTYDSGIVTIDLGTLATVPDGANAVILRCSVGINGQENTGGGATADFAYVHIEAAKNAVLINGGDPFSSNAYATLVSYVDTNLLKNDNNMTNDAIIPLEGSSFSYRAVSRFDDNSGTDTGTLRIDIIGFI